MRAIVFETSDGLLRCDQCGKNIECDENGDMPESCPGCGAELDWTVFDKLHKAE